ncbi:MAG: DUF3800 domain-containing protein [Candidatus Xenobiia bacterium LiM19]
MKLCYLDESGNSGNNDPNQPHYVLTGVIIDSCLWRKVTYEILNVITKSKPLFINDIVQSIKKDHTCQSRWYKLIHKQRLLPNQLGPFEISRLCADAKSYLMSNFEFHAMDLLPGNGLFRGVYYEHRLDVTNSLIDIIMNNAFHIVFIVIFKARHCSKYSNPAPVDKLAFMFFVEQFDKYLENMTGDKTGLIISDEINKPKEFKKDLFWYQTRATLYCHSRKIINIVDTIHFVESSASPCVQLSDLVGYLARLRWWKGRNNKYEDLYKRIIPVIKATKTFP